jgi:hypothetical protein
MNCLQARRTLLAQPRNRDAALDAHIDSCSACGKLARGVTSLDRHVGDAMSVPVPEALAHRILLPHRKAPLRQYAVAAVLAGAFALTLVFSTSILPRPFFDEAVRAVGPTHPAVTAITEIAEDGARRPVSEAEGSYELDQALKRLGLTLKTDEATAYYIGKCHVAGSECDHIVLSTTDAQANVMLVRGHPLGDRVLVADRHMIALVNPARTGGYIVVADTPKVARRIEKLLVKG